MTAPEPAANHKPHHTWRPIILWSSVLVAVLLTTCALGPVAVVQYHSWRYRHKHDGPDGTSLRWIANYAVNHRLSKEKVIRLLGDTNYGCSEDCLFYEANVPTVWSLTIYFDKGLAVRVEEAWDSK